MEMAPEDKELCALPRDGSCITVSRFMELFGPKFRQWEDCLGCSPRETPLGECKAAPLPQEADPFDEKLQRREISATSVIDDPQCSQVLPAGTSEKARSVLQQCSDALPSARSLVIEHWTVQALQTTTPHSLEGRR